MTSITRRLALFRIASASAAASAVAVPVTIAAVMPKSPENPTLVRLGQHLMKVDTVCRQRAADKAKTRAACVAMWPVLPDELVATNSTYILVSCEREGDCDNNDIWPDPPICAPRQYHSAAYIRTAIADLDQPDLDDEDRCFVDFLKSLLPIAERYEAAMEHAREASGYAEARSKHFRTANTIEEIVRKVAEIPARTPDGITIKARAYEASANNGKMYQFRAAQLIGPGLAADICRVLSEGDEA